MSIFIWLRKIVNTIFRSKDSIFNYEVEKQIKYLMSFEEPNDDIDRSFFQYKCQMKINGYLFSAMSNISSIFLLIYLIVKLSIEKHTSEFNVVDKKDAVFISNDANQSILPNELKKEYPLLTYTDNLKGMMIKKEDLIFIWKIFKRYPFSFYFIFKLILNFSIYRYNIEKYKPEAIICYSEYSFTSSMLTKYCEFNNIEHINIMHGEKLYYIQDAFVRFHRFYVWDQHYIDLFIKLRADINQFIIVQPDILKIKSDKGFNFFNRLTYYLGAEKHEDLLNIKNVLTKLNNQGIKINIRFHPRFCDEREINTIFTDFSIESPSTTTLEESFSKSRYIASLYSTVLLQAYMCGKEIIIDNLSNPKRYDKLEELDYIVLKKEHKKISDFFEVGEY